MVRKVRLIPDWKTAWRFASVRINALGLLLMAAVEMLSQAWVAIPVSVQKELPHASTLAMVLFGLGLIDRILTSEEDQKNG